MLPAPPKLRVAFAEKQNFSELLAVCPHCGAPSVFEQLITTDRGFNAPGTVIKWANGLRVGQCRGCKGIIIGVQVHSYINDKQARQVGFVLWPLETWPDRAPPGVAPEIRQAYDEARQVLPLSPMAAAVLARRALQHVLRKELKIARRRLFDEIEEAETREELSQPTRQALHHVREIGNWGAHPIRAETDASQRESELLIDEAHTVIEVTREEAEYTLEAVEMVFDDVYTAVARVAAMKARIEQRKTGNAGPDAAAGNAEAAHAPSP